MLELMFSEMTEAKSKSSSKFNSFRIMTIVDSVWRWWINFNILVLKTDKVLAFLRRGSILFHSIIVDGKKEFLKKLRFILRRGMFSLFLAEYNVSLTRIKLKRY